MNLPDLQLKKRKNFASEAKRHLLLAPNIDHIAKNKENILRLSTNVRNLALLTWRLRKTQRVNNNKAVMNERVLDISEFTRQKGFVSSSSDDEEPLKSLKAPTLNSNLSRIFGNETKQKAEPVAKERANVSIYSTAVNLFVLEGNAYSHKGKCGVALMKSSDAIFLIIYNAAKEKLANFLLNAENISLSSKDSYLNITSSNFSCSMLFQTATSLQNICAFIVMYSKIKSIVVEEGTGDDCPSNAYVNYSFRKVSLEDSGQYQIDKEETDESSRVETTDEKREKTTDDLARHCVGLSIGAVIIFSLTETVSVILKLTQWKSDDVLVKTEESSSANNTNILPDMDIGPLETTESNEDDSSLQKRMAKLGISILQPELTAHYKNLQSGALHPSKLDKKNEPSESSIDHDQASGNWKCSTVEDYSNIHRVVGIEMDRLEFRLQSFMRGLVDRSLEPIKNDIDVIKAQQLELSSQLQKIIEALKF
ncbi:unnamed protein product [Auanema sp. JU1783]|nr:unnamed protein product [Auanema sp. JU1783]